MLILIILLYNIIAFNKAEDITMPIDITGIVIENEPQLIPEEIVVEQPSVEITTWEIITEEIATWEIITEEIATWEIITEEIATWEIITWEIITWEIITWVELISGDQEYFSWVLAELSWEILYDLSGEIVGEIHVESWDIIPVDFSGESLLPQPLSVIYPTQQIQLNVSWYIMLDSLNSVITTWWEEGANYCSRIAYENLTSILKAWIRTYRETNDYVLQGDTDSILEQWITDNTVIEISSGDLVKIFSGDMLAANNQLYDVYSTFIVDWEKTYHRITVLYADDPDASGRYVLDPLRGAKTRVPQKLSNYIGYYDDETDVHRYIGQWYSPSVIKKNITHYDTIAQLFQEDVKVEILTWEVLTWKILTWEQILSTWVVETWKIFSGNEEIITGTVLEEIITGIIPEVIPEIPQIPEENAAIAGEAALQTSAESISWAQDTGVIEILTGEEIVTGYFDQAYNKWIYDDKIINLQKMFTRMQLYSGIVDGVYSDEVIESIYQYQLIKNIITPQDAVWLRGYLGPTTRKALNAAYVEYQMYEISLIQEQNILTWIVQELSTWNLQPETWNNNIIIPISGQETLNTIWILSWVNTIVLFDPLANPLFFSELLHASWYQSLLSGFVYTTGAQIWLTFSGTRKEIIKYLREIWYETWSITLVSISDKETLVGDVKLDFSQLSWMLLVPVILQSTNDLSWNIAEVSMPEWVMIKTADGENFTGELAPPVFLDPEIIQEQVDQEVISVIDVWSDQPVSFEDSWWNAMYATFRVPAPGMNIWDTIDINYSEDGENRIYMSSVNVQNIDGEPYAIFEANHFTTFYLWNTTGTFVIANDATYATWLAVTLNSNVTWATHMRFWNSIAERDGTGWITYTGTKAWNLTWTDGDGIKRVYAQFSGNGVVRNVSDAIIYDTSSWSMYSGLQAHLDGTTWTSLKFFDLGPRNLSWTGVGNARKVSVSWEDMIFVDGNGDYIQNTSWFITWYPFTISAWVKTSRVNVTQVIATFGSTASASVYRRLQLVNNQAQIALRNTKAATVTSTATLVANKRYHIVWVFLSDTSRQIYVDNAYPSAAPSTTSAPFSNASPQRMIGSKHRTPGSYFSWWIDEVRVYNKALTTGERQELYMIPPTFDTQTAFTGTPTLYGEFTPKEYLSGTTVVISGYTINTTTDGPGKWKTVPFTTGLANGTYNVTINYSNIYGKTGTVTYTWGLVINSTWVNVTYSPSTTTTGSVIATLTGLDPTYMIVNNFGSEFYTFTGNGNFTWQYVDKQGTTGSTTAMVDWIKSAIITYSTWIFYENAWLNNGSITWNIIATLSTWSFSWVAANYIMMSNIPSGLTWVFTLSGTNQIIITLSWNANNHASDNNISNISISFATWAFINMNPSDVVNSTQTWIAISFYDAPGFIAGQQLRVNGILSWGQFYDWSPNHRVTTIVGGATSVVQWWETMMSFNGADQFINVWAYALTGNYSISARFKSNVVDGTRRSVIGDSDGSRELSLNSSDKISAYSNGSLASTMTILANTWYHVVVVKNSTGTKLYINGVLDGSNTSTTTINTTLSIGDSPYYLQPRSGNIDEVKIYDSAITDTQVESLYMNKPSFVAKTVNTDLPILTWWVSDTSMALSLTISWSNYSVTNNGNGTRTSSSIGPLSSGTYNVQLNYANVYGKTWMLMYTGGLIVDLSWVNIAPRASVTYVPWSWTYTTGTVVATLTWFNKTGITITNNSWSATYAFTENWSFTFQFADDVGATWSATATVDWIKKAILNYSTWIFYEDSSINTWSITWNIIATLSTWSFSWVAANYITLSNVPAGLTWVFTLSGTQKIIITLSGTATNHTSSDNVSNIIISFATWAFINMNPSDVVNSTQTWIAISFYDAPGFIAGQQLRIDGTLSGGQFYDRSPNHRATTGYGSISNSTRSWETVMGPFDGSSRYVSVWAYTLTNYTMSAWFMSNGLSAWRTIIGQNGWTAFEISQNTSNKISFYDVSSSVVSTTTIAASKWYHVVRVQSGTNTYMYIDGVLENTIPAVNNLSTMELAIGKYSTSQYRSGNIDEVKIYDTAITATQVENLYMTKPSFVAKTVNTGTVILTGLSDDTSMILSLTISWSNYSVTNNGNGTRTSSSIGPLSSGTYNVKLNYANVYGKTWMLMYTWGLIVSLSTGDTTPPTFAGVMSWLYYSGNVAITFADENLSWATVNGNPYTSWMIITWDWNYTFVVSDLAGNSTWATFTIDKTIPLFAGVTSWATYTGTLSWGIYIGNVVITFADDNLSWANLNWSPYVSWTMITWEGNYIFVVHDLAGNSTWASFSIQLPTEQKINNQLINSWYSIGMTWLTSLDENYYIWNANIDMAPFSGNLLVATLLQSDNTFWGNFSEVQIPAWAVLENAGATSFVGILNVPTFLTPSNYDSAIGTTAISAIDVGSTNHIYFKDTGSNDLSITYRMPVPGRSEGDLVDVFMSEDGVSFSYHTTVRTILIGGNPYVSFEATHMSVVVTAANNGTNISADKAANSTSGSAYTLLSNIVIAEWVNTDLGVSQTNVTLILTAPTNRRFRAGSGTITYTAKRDVTAATIAVTSTTATITYSTNGTPNRLDTLTISGLWIQAITGNILPSTGNILRTCANSGTAPIVWITCDVTNFWSLSQTFGAHKYLAITLPGQTFIAWSGNSWTALNQTVNTQFVIPKITAADQFYNIVTSYTWAKTLAYTGPGGMPTYTTGVTFAGGQSTTTLNTTLTQVANGVTITASGSSISGPASSAFNVVASGSLSITWPASFDFGQRNASEQIQTIEKTFSWTNDYFQIIDRLWYDTGYYTTISISDMTNGNGDKIWSGFVAIKALTGVVTLSGTYNPRVYSAITWAYQYFTAAPLTFIKRDTAANWGVTGIYGLHTSWKIDIPVLQDPGMYTGVITYTLY